MRSVFNFNIEPFEAYSEFEEEDGTLELFSSEFNHNWLGKINRKSPDYIRWVQSSLNNILGTRLVVDGILGRKTRSAIRSFQQRQGLVADGIVGSKTEAALIAAGASSPPSAAVTPTTPGYGVTPEPSPTSPAGVGVSQVCPEPARKAMDRCINPGTQTCPAIPNLLCVKEVDGIPFEYHTLIRKDPTTGLYIVADRIHNRTQRFIPSVRDALNRFIANISKFAMPIEAILTAGSLYCRCVSNTDTLSNHSFGDAIDVVGVRWSKIGGPASRLPDTIVHNYQDPGERVLLRRINACLRLSFVTVIDYHRSDHRDHFHCDMNRGRGRNPTGWTILVFVQEALSNILGRSLPSTGKLDTTTKQGLKDFSGLGDELFTNTNLLNETFDRLFIKVASGQ